MNENKPAHPQPVLQMRITAMSDGNVNVSGFPTSLRNAQNLLNMAAQATIEYFIEQAKAGNLDDNNTVIPKKIIESKKPALVGADGKLVR